MHLLKYLQIYPETMDALEELDDAQLGRMIRAMVRYATQGEGADFERGTPERILWAAMAQRVDAARDRSEQMQANGSRRRQTEANGSNGKQTGADGSNGKQTEANGNPESESDTESESDPKSEKPEGHTQEHPEGESAGAREEKPGWFRPEDPKAGHDEAWRGARARSAIAQRITDHACKQLAQRITVTEAGVVGEDLHAALVAAMRSGIPPDYCTQLIQGCTATWEYELALKRVAIATGGDVPEEWRRQVAELAEESSGRGLPVCS